MASSTTCALLVLLAALVHTGAALSCWSCSTDSKGICGDPFNTTRKSNLINCNPSFTNPYNRQPDEKMVCRKMVETSPNGLTIIRRTCTKVVTGIDACRPSDPSNTLDFCGICDDVDGCNKGPLGVQAHIAVISAAMFAIFFFL